MFVGVIQLNYSGLFRETHNIFEKKNVDTFPITYIYYVSFIKLTKNSYYVFF